MLRGDIYLVNFEPAKSGEANKVRPAVIVSNDGANGSANRNGHGVITVIPLTSNVTQVYPFQVLLKASITGLNVDSKAQAEQLRSVAVNRLSAHIGEVPHSLMEDIDEALRLHLAL